LIGVLVGAMLFSGCGDAAPEKSLAAAKSHLERKDLKSADIELRNALQADPALAEARFLLGSVLLREGDAAAAETQLRKALEAKHPPAAVVPLLAEALLETGQADKVVAEFAGVGLGVPFADASLKTTLALAYYGLGKPELGESALAAALATDPHHGPAHLVQARQQAAAGDFDKALATIEEVAAADRRNAGAVTLRGDVLRIGLGKPDGAALAYREALAIDPDFLPAHVALLQLLLQEDRLDEARRQLTEVERLAQRSPGARFLEAQLAYRGKDYALARTLCQQLLAAASPEPAVLELAGAVEFELNSLPQAEAYLVAATHAVPELTFARRLLVKTYLRSGQASKAVSVVALATPRELSDPAFQALAGQAYLQNGDAKNAAQAFERASHLDPGSAPRRTALAMSRIASGQVGPGVSELETIAAGDTGITADLAVISAHLGRHEYANALAAIARLEAKQSATPLAPQLRGMVRMAQGDRAGARESFGRALAIDGTYFAAINGLAALDLAEGRPDDARRRFEGLLAVKPRSAPALLALAELAAARGAGKEEVAALLVKGIQASPGEAVPRLLLVNHYLAARDLERAAAAAQEGVSALPASPELLDALGRVQLEAGESNQALATFAKLVAMQPTSPMPYMRMAAAQTAARDALAAEQSARKALGLGPGNPQLENGLIVVLLAADRYPEALAAAHAVQKQRPRDSAGYVFEGDILAWQKKWASAAAAYRAAQEAAPSTPVAIKLHNAVELGEGASEARRVADAWMKAHPQDTRYLTYLADTALARSEFTEAEGHYTAVVRLEPRNAVALNNLAWTTHRLQKPGAVGYAEQAHAFAPAQPEFMDTLAVMLSAAGNHSRAIDVERKALAFRPANTSFRLNLAKIYIASGDKVRAKGELQALAALGGGDAVSNEAASLLKAL
jgi:putative PEP-CTERM system TPR-repeat lipoprotein